MVKLLVTLFILRSYARINIFRLLFNFFFLKKLLCAHLINPFRNSSVVPVYCLWQVLQRKRYCTFLEAQFKFCELMEYIRFVDDDSN